MLGHIVFNIRWYWNYSRYRLGLTPFSPALHEANRMYRKLQKEMNK